jgi:hypothetical protein
MNDKINLLIEFFNNKWYSSVTFGKLESVQKVSFYDSANRPFHFYPFLGEGRYSIINYFSINNPYMMTTTFKL